MADIHLSPAEVHARLMANYHNEASIDVRLLVPIEAGLVVHFVKNERPRSDYMVAVFDSRGLRQIINCGRA